MIIDIDELFASLKPAVEGATKFCNGCKTTKSHSEFHKRKDRGSSDKYGLVSRCKDCSVKQHRTWYYNNHEEQKLQGRIQQYKRRHGARITNEEATQLATTGGMFNNCESCSTFDLLVIDHDHKTGVRRGMLCNKCNLALGLVNDSIDKLEALSNYLQRHGIK